MRSRSDVIELISYRKEKNENGVPMNREISREVFAEIKSVSRSEYWQAQSNNVTLTIAFAVRACEYDGERVVRYDGKLFRVRRAPCPDGEWYELNCSDEAV